jgi:hypothetical protein
MLALDTNEENVLTIVVRVRHVEGWCFYRLILLSLKSNMWFHFITLLTKMESYFSRQRSKKNKMNRPSIPQHCCTKD